MKKKIDFEAPANTNAAPSHNTGGSVEESEALKRLVVDANNREAQKLPTMGAGVDPVEVHSAVRQIKNAHRKLAARGLVGSLKSFAREQMTTNGPEAEDAKIWLHNKATLAHKAQTPKPKIVKKSKAEKKAAADAKKTKKAA